VRYWQQELVFLRDDSASKMVRHCVVQPDPVPISAADLAAQYARTVVSEAHLSPVPLAVTPVHWAHDHALWLHPLPHLVVVADRSPAFALNVADAIVANPGPFSRDFSFIAFTPHDRTATVCKLPEK
jgi:DNA polymerase epsilon subunit 2